MLSDIGRELFIIVLVISIVMVLLLFILLVLRLYDTLERDKRYSDMALEERTDERHLSRVRVTYLVSCIVFIVFTILLAILFGSGLEDISISFIFIYLGLGGLIARAGFLKLPISFTSKLYYIINPLLIVLGVLLIVDFYLDISWF